jgi:DNA invertase Pin-like site-specific DNA recombinase
LSDKTAGADEMSEQHWKNIAVYCRVSKKEQTVEQQMAAIAEWLGKRADKLTPFEEKKSSRKNRPIKEAMMVRVRSGEFDAVAVWKLDRFARDAYELLALRKDSDDLGFTILSLCESIDTSTGNGRFMYTVIAGLAELERDNVRTRTKAKLDYRKSQGLPPGGKQRIEYDEEKARRLAPLLSVRALAVELGVSKSTADRIKKALGIVSSSESRPETNAMDQNASQGTGEQNPSPMGQTGDKQP